MSTTFPNIVKCKCQHCNGHIEFDANNTRPGMTVPCPHCGMETTLFVPQSQRPKVSAPPKPASQTENYLKQLRANSMYPMLRRLINVCIWMLSACGYIIPFVAISMAQAELLSSLSAYSPTIHYSMLWPIIAGLAAALICGTICLVILIALRQSAHLLIDIADTLLSEHSKTTENILK